MITKVWIDETYDECVCCGACEAICDAIFRVPEKCEIVGDDFATYDAEIRDAVDCCPADVIRYAEDGKAVPTKKTAEPTPELEYPEANEEEHFEKPNIFKLVEIKKDKLTFESAVEVLLYVLPETHLYFSKIDAPLLDQTCGKYTSLMDIRGTWRLPKRPLNRFTIGDIFVDRQTVWYKMFVNDLAGKPFKSKQLHIPVRNLTVGQFMDFVSTQFEIANK